MRQATKPNQITKKLILIIFVLSISTAHARSTNDMFGSWNSLILSGDFGTKSVKWQIVEQGVWRDDSPEGLRLFDDNLFAQIGYNTGQYSSVWIGYLHDWIHPLGKPAFQESRPYQDYLWIHPVWNGRFSVRTRFEERINQDTGDIGVRVRETLQVNYPLAAVKDLGVYVGGDVFFYFNQNSFGPTGFHEARAAAGFTYNLNQHLGIDLGYLGVAIITTGKSDIFSHNLQVNLRYNF